MRSTAVSGDEDERASDPGSDARPISSFAAHDYPWTHTAEVWVPGRPDDDLSGRTPVVAVGSNASPAVLAAKLRGVSGDRRPPLTRVRVPGIAVGHSAHIAARGYVPAAPFRREGAVLDTVAAWLTDVEVAALDTTEPNYRRLRLADHPVDGLSFATDDISLYVSRHGLLGEPGSSTPVAFTAQADIVAWLRAHLEDPALRGPIDEVCRGLAKPETTRRITDAIRSAGLVVTTTPAAFSPESTARQ